MAIAIANILCIQSFDFIPDNEPPTSGSIIRIRAACDLIKERRIPADCFVLWPQGYQKKNSTLWSEICQRSLGENLADFTRKQPEMSEATILHYPFSWGTKGDMRASYAMVAQLGYNNAHFYFVSDLKHLKRVWFTWWMTHPKGWTADFFPALGHKMRFIDRVPKEYAKWVYYTMAMFPGPLLGRKHPSELRLRRCPQCKRRSLKYGKIVPIIPNPHEETATVFESKCWICGYHKILPPRPSPDKKMKVLKSA